MKKNSLIRKTFVFILLILSSASLWAQKTVKDTHTTIYVISPSETIRQAEINAVMQAQTEMIAEHFGTLVGIDDLILMKDGNTTGHTYAETEVKGEWIETTAEPIIRKSVRNDSFVLEVTVSGKIREISSTPIDLRCKVLRNGDTDRCEDTSFRHGDYLYLSFQTPVSGYLTVYLTDGQTVQCLFPYKGIPVDSMKVDADTRYVLFSKRHSGNIDPSKVQKMRLGCTDDVEYDRLYVIFSPNKYVKAVDHDSAGTPRQLGIKEFHEWLSKMRRMDKDMNVRGFGIEIRK